MQAAAAPAVTCAHGTASEVHVSSQVLGGRRKVCIVFVIRLRGHSLGAVL